MYIKSHAENVAMPDYSLLGLAIAAAGIVVIVFAVIVSSSRHEGDGKARVKGAGVVMVGPIPIVFGTDIRWTVVAIVLAIVLLALGLLTTFR
jgi:uncharacterized protein (TIGR00304 family)